MRLALAALLLLAVLPATAASLRDVRVDVVDGMYVLRSEAWFDAGVVELYEVLLDWDRSTEFSSVVVESRNVEPGEDGRPGFYSRIRGCLLLFCRSFERNGTVAHKPYEYIVATADPNRSDFHISEEHWRFRTEENGTVIVYDLVVKPKFWIPPVIGPYALKRKLKSSGGDALDRIEAAARALRFERAVQSGVDSPTGSSQPSPQANSQANSQENTQENTKGNSDTE